MAGPDRLNMRALLIAGLLTLTCPALPALASASKADTASTIMGDGASPAAAAVVGTRAAPGSPVMAYFGIPYVAVQPAGAHRWTEVEKAAWPPSPGKTFEATAPGPQCPQTGETGQPVGEEACLFLNIWAPETAINGQRKLPVMVFIHGGSFVEGTGSWSIYDGRRLASEDTVVVTINYRLGALGFLSLDDLPAGDGGTTDIRGNFGIHDQRAALAWVAGNIHRFGGDPAKVTIFGESAGASSVSLHLFSIKGDERPLFRAAIMQSNPLGLPLKNRKDASLQGWEFVDLLCQKTGRGDSIAACGASLQWLRSLPAADILKFQSGFNSTPPWNWDGQVALTSRDLAKSIVEQSRFGYPSFAPVIDGDLILAHPSQGFVEGAAVKPFVYGMNRDEGALFAALLLGNNLAAQDSTEFQQTFKKEVAPLAVSSVTSFTRGAVQPYAAESGNGFDVLSSILNDRTFRCSNTESVAKARNQGAKAYGYLFQQRPVYSFYGSLPACLPSAGRVCHGFELPYVFGVIAEAYQAAFGKPLPPDGGDVALAQRMVAAWAGFARNPDDPPAPWSESGQDRLTVWGNADGSATLQSIPIGSFETTANCALWDRLTP
jgi:carboxylesterase type B